MEKTVEDRALEIGESMLTAGAEIFRVEDTVKRILKAYGIKEYSVFCISFIIIISDENGTFSRRVGKTNIDLAKLDRLNALSREICENKVKTQDYKTYKKLIQFLSVIIATGSFSLYFGGTIKDAAVSGIIGILINFRKTKISISFSDTFFDSLLSGIFAGFLCIVFPALNFDKIIIGTIMLLVPGLTITSAIRDIMFSDTISGVIELFDSLFTAIAISLGCACSLAVIKWLSLYFA